MNNRRKELIAEYMQAKRPMGVFRIRNEATGKTLVVSHTNVPGGINGQRTRLFSGMHPCRELQSDFKKYGEASFAFEILEMLESEDGARNDYKDINRPDGVNYDLAKQYKTDLEQLKQYWKDKLQAEGVSLYEERGS